MALTVLMGGTGVCVCVFVCDEFFRTVYVLVLVDAVSHPLYSVVRTPLPSTPLNNTQQHPQHPQYPPPPTTTHRFEEKEFMKLWNTHVAAFPPWGDTFLPPLCESFVTMHAEEIYTEKMRYLALLHFITMWKFGLLRRDEVMEYMMEIDRVRVGMNQKQMDVDE